MDDCDGYMCNDPACREKRIHNNKTPHETHCLGCMHVGKYHAELQDRFSKFMYWLFMGRTTGCTVGSWCKCSKYIQNDNLLYLEELSK